MTRRTQPTTLFPYTTLFRSIRVLERFVEQSQFIIITHNKRTIAKADVLYGVTMEERGVSRLVGMKLTPPRQVSTELTSNGGEQNSRQQRLALEIGRASCRER